MKTIFSCGLSLLTLCLITPTNAGEHFLQMRVERSRCCLPRYDYQAARASAVSVVVSEPAVLILMKATETPADLAFVDPNQPRRAFVMNDLTAGPLVFTSLGAKTDATGAIRVTGILNHNGGDSGQLLGGKAVIRVEPLTATGTAARAGTTLGVREQFYWIRRNQPETIQMDVQYENSSPWSFGDVERVRVFLEYHPSR